MCGTILWLAPEIMAEEEYTEKADVFSFGIIVWEILMRMEPYEGMSLMEVAIGVMNANLRPSPLPNCPILLKDMMKACWHPNPDQRPSFSEIVELLSKQLE